MYIGKNRDVAQKQAQANAKRSGQPWVMWLYGAVWYIERADSYTNHLPDGAIVFHADPHNPCRGAFDCLKTGLCPFDPVCNN